ncbi:DNA-binding protein [Pseudomonas entomophila]|uniref:DNA-binding protein n=1 Tax=Pseudomonas entomophila TaxID=312306 RepID=UPI0023D879DB|nr:DNA-binding protein [Pseudomonas entomophila]MDF0732198.1 DNA-binding protein [Pseudomonas entomophila]
MPRGGVDKAAVRHARQALIARGEHPSIDAVRIELGNTGSKTTIHRYLKELEAQPSQAQLGSAALSAPLTLLVEQLAAQLQEEAQARIDAAEAAFEEQREQLQAQVELARQALAAAHQQQQVQANALAAESERLAATQNSLQAEQLRNATLNQAVGDLQLRVADKDEQMQKLQAEIQRLQQGLAFRQEEATRLHRDNERLQAQSRQGAEARKVLQEQLEQRDAQVQGLRSILAQAQGASDEMRRQLQVCTQELEAKREACVEQARQVERLQERLSRCLGRASTD